MKGVSLLQKELGQKDRLLLQNQAKLEEALRQLSEASYQQVGTMFHHWLSCPSDLKESLSD